MHRAQVNSSDLDNDQLTSKLLAFPVRNDGQVLNRQNAIKLQKTEMKKILRSHPHMVKNDQK